MKDLNDRAEVLDTRPEVERDAVRTSELGFEPIDEGCAIRCISQLDDSTRNRWHHHAEYEIRLIGDCAGTACIGDWVGEFRPGQLVLLGPWIPHHWICATPAGTGCAPRQMPDLALQIAQEPLLTAARAVRELRPLDWLLSKANQAVEFEGLASDFQELWRQIRASRGLERFGAFCALLATLERCSDTRLLSGAQPKEDSRANALRRIVRSIQQDPSPEPCIPDLARQLGASEGHFLRLFRQHTGMPFHAYLTHTRIAAACRLLVHTDHYVQSIGYQVGFNNIANFNRRFMEAKGVTPSEYRRQARGPVELMSARHVGGRESLVDTVPADGPIAL